MAKYNSSLINIGGEKFIVSRIMSSFVTDTKKLPKIKLENLEDCIIPGGTVLTKTIKKPGDSHVRLHARELELIGEDASLIMMESKTIHIRSAKQFKIFCEEYGRTVGYKVVLDAVKLSKQRKFNSVFIHSSVHKNAMKKYPVYGLAGRIIPVNNGVKFTRYESETLKEEVKYYCKMAKTSKARTRVNNIPLSSCFFMDNNEVGYRPRYDSDGNNLDIKYISESILARHFGKRDGKIIDLTSFATFKGSISKAMVEDHMRERLEITDLDTLPKADYNEEYAISVGYWEDLRERGLVNGIINVETGERFNYANTSGGQSRTESCMLSTYKWEEVYGFCVGTGTLVDENGMANPAKFDKRLSLQLTGTKRITKPSSVIVIHDREMISSAKQEKGVRVLKSGETLITKHDKVDLIEKFGLEYFLNEDGTVNRDSIPEKYKENVIITKPADGQGVGSLKLFARISVEHGYITQFQADQILKIYKKCNSLTELSNRLTGDLSRAYDNMIKLITLRYGSSKGAILLYDFDKRYPQYADYELVLTETAYKFSMEYDEKHCFKGSEMAFCLNSKELTGQTMWNYQAIAACGIDGSLLKSIIKGEMDKIKDSYKDPVQAMAVLNIIRHADEEAGYDQKFVSLVTEALSAGSDSFFDPYINGIYRGLLAKMQWDMGFGKVPVPGDWAFIITDPEFMFGNLEECLEEDEYYLAGKEQEVLLSRPPISDGSEIAKVRLTDCERFHYLRNANVIIFNPYCLTLLRMADADTDGDKTHVLYLKSVVDAFKPRDYVLNNELSVEPITMKITGKNLASFVARTMSQSSVGVLANWNTVFTDMYLSGIEKYIAKTGREIPTFEGPKQFRFLQGFAIDEPGKQTIPEWAKIKETVEWLHAKKWMDKDSRTFVNIKGNYTVPDNVHFIDSNSAMTQGFNYVKEEMQKFDVVETDNDFSMLDSLLKLVNSKDVTLMKPKMKEFIKRYNEAVRRVFDKPMPEGLTKDQIEDENRRRWEEVRNVGKDINETCRNAASTLAEFYAMIVAAYELSYKKEFKAGMVIKDEDSKKGKSFVWNVFRNEMIEMIGQAVDGVELVRFRTDRDDIETVEVDQFKIGYVDDKPVGNFNLPKGEYKVRTYEDKKFLVVPKTKKPAPEFVKSDKNISEVKLDCREVMTADVVKKLEENKFTIEVKPHNNTLYAFAGGEPLARLVSFGMKDKKEAKNKVFVLRYSEFAVMYKVSDSYKREYLEWTDENKEYAYKKMLSFFCEEVGVIDDSDREANTEKAIKTVNGLGEDEVFIDDLDIADMGDVEQSTEDLRNEFESFIDELQDEMDDFDQSVFQDDNPFEDLDSFNLEDFE